MLSQFYHKRFTIFLASFLLLLFGNLLVPKEFDDEVKAVLLLQNIVCSLILFVRQSKRTKLLVYLVVFSSIVIELVNLFGGDGSLLFAFVYLIYFVLISYRLFDDLKKQRVVGIEMVSAAFCGFILLGVVSSIIFLSIDASMDAFSGAIENREFPDFLYFSFITLLTIGYGDIVPANELSQKLVIILGLIGHFYTVFVMAIVIGKYLSAHKPKGD
ncbi:MAG: two pore domain potassium channel family protein [Cyclobacteriaceae bacterium]